MTKVNVWGGKVGPGDLLYLPPGYLIAASSLTGEETFGARRLMVKTHNNQGFTQLKAAVVPTVASQIKANSAAALLNKLGAAEVTCVFWCVGRCKG